MDLHRWAGVNRDGAGVTLAVVLTDIIDSTTLTRSVGDKEMFDMLFQHFAEARSCCREFDGFEIKLIGDAYMAAFRTADAALRFALAFRQNTGDPRIGIRVGIHVGQVRIREGDIYGLMVNYAARLCHVNVAGEEGIFMSASVKRDIESEYGTNPQDFRILRVLASDLKGFGGREEIWQIVTPEIRVARAARVRAKQEEEARKKAKPAGYVPSASPQVLGLPAKPAGYVPSASPQAPLRRLFLNPRPPSDKKD
jgi:class 3 adenylate cyclase